MFLVIQSDSGSSRDCQAQVASYHAYFQVLGVRVNALQIANIVAQMDDVLRDREAAGGPTADDIFTRMSAYMEAPAAA